MSNTGDISSVFSHIENDKLFFRVTFDDMYNRNTKTDNFYNNKIYMDLIIKNGDIVLYKELINIQQNIKKDEKFQFLRTSKYNLFELTLNWLYDIDTNNLTYEVSILLNDDLVDYFNSNETYNRDGGNAAFVHHGNQGLTYSQVFYGQEPLEITGFDEILEVHQATGIPGNFHMSGTLMPAAEWHNPEFNDWLVSGVNDGYVSMLTSALGQHMMPFVHNDMNNWSVAIETDMVEYRYGYSPKVAWIPERVWLSPGIYPEAGVIDWF
jgi:hypothetical protein